MVRLIFGFIGLCTLVACVSRANGDLGKRISDHAERIHNER